MTIVDLEQLPPDDRAAIQAMVEAAYRKASELRVKLNEEAPSNAAHWHKVATEAQDEIDRLRLLEKVDDWVKADAARFRWLQEHTVAAGLGRFMQQHSTQFLAQAVDAAVKAEREREDLMSVERGRKVGDLTRKIRKQQGRQ